MAQIRELKEFFALDAQIQSDLLPEEFLDDPEVFVLRYGNIEYLHFNNTTLAQETCLIELKDRSKLKYSNERVMYLPKISSYN